MTANDESTQTAARLVRWARRLRMTSVVVLLAGVAVAGAIFAFGTGPVESDDPATIAEDKIDSREVGRMYGDVGVLEKDLANQLKQPDTQAVLIVAVTAVVAGACFGAARFLERRGDRAV